MPYMRPDESIMSVIDSQNEMCAMLDGKLNVRVYEATFEGEEKDVLELLKHNLMPSSCLFKGSKASYNSSVNDVCSKVELKFKVKENPVRSMIWYSCSTRNFKETEEN